MIQPLGKILTHSDIDRGTSPEENG